MKSGLLDFPLKSALKWQVIFLLLTAAALIVRTPATVGIYLLLLCLTWDLLFFLWAKAERSVMLRQIIIFSMLLSLFQVFPDWVLSRLLGVLVFPPDGLFKWDTVSGYMALLWAIPASTILVTYQFTKNKFGTKVGYVIGIAVGAVLFVGSEELVYLLPSWYAVNVVKWGHVARYIIVPELILTLLIISIFERVRERSLAYYALSAGAVSAIYAAAAVIFYFIAG